MATCCRPRIRNGRLVGWDAKDDREKVVGGAVRENDADGDGGSDR